MDADTWCGWYRLALDLRSVAPDCAAAPGIDYERLSQRVQSSPVEPDVPHGFGRGHVRPDRVAERPRVGLFTWKALADRVRAADAPAVPPKPPLVFSVPTVHPQPQAGDRKASGDE